MPQRYKIQGAPELASRLRRALDQQDISGGELELTFSPEVLVKDASVPPFVQDPVYFSAPEFGAAVVQPTKELTWVRSHSSSRTRC